MFDGIYTDLELLLTVAQAAYRIGFDDALGNAGHRGRSKIRMLELMGDAYDRLRLVMDTINEGTDRSDVEIVLSVMKDEFYQ